MKSMKPGYIVFCLFVLIVCLFEIVAETMSFIKPKWYSNASLSRVKGITIEIEDLLYKKGEWRF